MSSDTDLKPAGRTPWTAGDYDAIAELSWEVGEVVAGAVAIEAGMKVLDVATGTGCAAIAAASLGATAIGLDISPEHFEAARKRAADAGVEVEWVEGDAAALPYEDDSFDRVLSAFGAIYAADCSLAVNELVRVCRPGGEIVMANWSADGFGGRLSDLLRSYGESSGSVAASQWGTFGHVRRTLGGQLVLAIEPRSVDLVFESRDAMLAHLEQNLGPLVVAKAELEAGSYGALRGQLRALIEELDCGEGSEVRVPSTYKLVIGHKPVAM